MRKPIRILAALGATAVAGLAVTLTRALSAAPEEVELEVAKVFVEWNEVELEKENDEPILQTFDVILRPTQTSVAVPAAFLEPLTAYKFEVIAVLEGGNRTITESGTFTTN